MVCALVGFGYVSQSAFVRGFIDDRDLHHRSPDVCPGSQSAFVRGFIDDKARSRLNKKRPVVSIRVRARLHR